MSLIHFYTSQPILMKFSMKEFLGMTIHLAIPILLNVDCVYMYLITENI